MPLPIPDLDTKDFDDFFEEARSALPPLAPEWTDYNLSDPGITLLELFSWLSDINTYRLDRIDQKHILKYLKLLNAVPKPVEPAKCWITFKSDSLGSISQGTELLAKDTKRNISIPFITQHDIYLQNTELVSIKLKNERGLLSYKQELFPRFFYPFGQITKKGHYFELAFESAFSTDFSLTFILYEDDLPSIGKHDKETPVVFSSAELLWEYWNGSNWMDLEIEEDGTNSLSKSGTIYFKETADAPIDTFTIKCKLNNYHFENAPRIQSILTNTTEAIQIKEDEKEFEEAGTGLPNQILQLKEFPLVSIGVKIDSEEWKETESLEISTHDKKVFQVDKNSGTITFGDGIHGAIPLLKSTITCAYTTSMGADGNIIKNLEWSVKNIAANIKIQNHFPATGGKDPQSIEEAFITFKKDFRTPYQAVTAGDFEYLAIHTPGLRVARAKALAYPEHNRVEVIVVPFSLQEKPYPTKNFLTTICRYLEKHRLITTRIKTTPPLYVLVSIAVDIKLKKGFQEDESKSSIERSIASFLHPLKGWKNGEGWPFGQDVYRSDIYSLLEKHKAVDCITYLDIQAENHDNDSEGNVPLKSNELTLSYQHKISFSNPKKVCRSQI